MSKEKQIQIKLNRPFAYKSIGNNIADIDTTGRTVVFYASAFDKIDDQLDIVRKGAFKKSIQEWGPDSSATRRIKHCLFHDERHLPGAIKELSEDNYGLKVAVKMSDTVLGNDTLQYYQDGIYTEHSLRAYYVDGKIRWVTDKSLPSEGFYDITEFKLYHTATVPFASNDNTHVVGFKSMDTPEDFETALLQVNKRMNNLLAALKNGRYSEDAFKDISYQLKECQDTYNSLIEAKPVDKATLLRDEPDTNKEAEAPDYSFLKSFTIY